MDITNNWLAWALRSAGFVTLIRTVVNLVVWALFVWGSGLSRAYGSRIALVGVGVSFVGWKR